MMLTATTDLVNLDVGSAAVMALLGYAVVFFGIILLMIVVMIMGKIFIAKDAREKAKLHLMSFANVFRKCLSQMSFANVFRKCLSQMSFLYFR